MRNADVARAATRPNKVISLSMEDPAVDAQVTIHEPDREIAAVGSMKTFSVRAGDPDVFGFIQVVINDDGTVGGLLDLTVVRRYPSGGIAPNFYSTGTVPSDDTPKPSRNDPSRASWQ